MLVDRRRRCNLLLTGILFMLLLMLIKLINMVDAMCAFHACSITALKTCIVNKHHQDGSEDDLFYRTMSRLVTFCTARHSRIRHNDFFSLRMGRHNEIKYFLKMFINDNNNSSDHDDNNNCKWLTIGIGGDVQVEREFIKLYPRCRLYGIEPSRDQSQDFLSYGTVIQHAVGAQRGRLTMRLRENGGYVNREVAIEPLHETLDRHLHSRLVHFATLDIEGGEYGILQQLKYDAIFERNGVVFCQLDVELHFGHAVTSHVLSRDFNFSAFYLDLLLNSPYVPVKAVDFYAHRKLTLIHEKHEECERIFQWRRFFDHQ